MRWDALFADLEAQLDQAEATEQQAEVADRSRRELAAITLLDRASAHLGAPVQLGVLGVGVVQGVLVDAAAQWLLVEEPARRPLLVPAPACLWVRGLGRAADVQPGGSVTRRLGLGPALRSLARQRLSVRIELVDGAQLTGTIDRVHADHLDLAEHPSDEQRRRAAVREVRAVPFAALAIVRPT